MAALEHIVYYFAGHCCYALMCAGKHLSVLDGDGCSVLVCPRTNERVAAKINDHPKKFQRAVQLSENAQKSRLIGAPDSASRSIELYLS